MADHGISSQSRQAQVVSSFAQSPRRSSAARTRSRNCRSSSGSLKNRRPVRVKTMPSSPVATPNRSRAACFVPADDHHGPRPHVLLFADDLRDALAAVVGERLGRVLQQPGSPLVSHGDMRGRQIDQPPRVGGEPAHHLQRGGGVLLPDRDVACSRVEMIRLPSTSSASSRSSWACCADRAGACCSAGRNGRAGSQ